MGQKMRLPMFDDMHLHVRDGEMLRRVLKHSLPHTQRAVIMPNLHKPILTGLDVRRYRDEICQVAQEGGYPDFVPLMTIAIQDSTTPEIIREAHTCGAIAGKVYPFGVTTNSQNGLRDFFSKQSMKNFRTMEELGMPVLFHGEIDFPHTLVTEREHAFIYIFERLHRAIPSLKKVFEHLTTARGVHTVANLSDTVRGTITAHHLYTTLNDILGYGIRPHNMCMPVPKDFADRDALIKAATSGNPKFFLGSDSAPHVRHAKECNVGACGVFTAPILPELLMQIFEEAGRLDQLYYFTSSFGAEFYGLKLNEKTFTLEKREWKISNGYPDPNTSDVFPDDCDDIVPFKAGETLRWKRL